ncbi:MAG: histidine phosphatase family protein [Candidatus Accumulibacter phosphatis]|uniref:histidine phosphatase family protein n=1 Tax=Candidatus Accumulibacter TaxID=327159 RepID=UPI0004B12616|nr:MULTISPECIES: histidine phosphatase family protein [Candidatus Accumulibacter]HRF11719.1 histidine phosphatase family protein [Candidatus Accumulibacter phosphatis]
MAEGKRTLFSLLILSLAAMASSLPARADGLPVPLGELAKPGRLLMLRHAHAPGVGDPPNFVIGDCSTQRNLDASGRAQARQLGARLRAAGLTHARVFSSQWCRALETARLLDLGPVEPLPALNSFFERQDDRQRILDGLRAFLARLPIDGQPVILVTHQVVVNAFTEATPPAGGGSIFQINGSGAPKWLGTIPIETRGGS